MNSQHKFHNRHNLTPEQVGDGYRLLLESEIMNRPISKDIHCWDDHQNKWDTMGWGGYGSGQTYRVPLATWPLPEEYACPPVKSPEVEELQSRFDPEIPWTEWHGGECPLKDEEVEEWEFKFRDGDTLVSNGRPSRAIRWHHHGNNSDVVAYRVLKWKNKPAQEPPPTDNDAWECLLRTNADLGREVSELKAKVGALTWQLEDANRLKQSALEGVKMWSARSNQNADDIEKREKVIESLSSQLQGVTTSCHLRGYNVGDSLGEWIEKQFEDAETKLKATETRLAQLEWVPFSERKPNSEDCDPAGRVIATDGLRTYPTHWSFIPGTSTHWRPLCLPASIDTDRVEFKKFVQERGDGYMPRTENQLFEFWKAARRTK